MRRLANGTQAAALPAIPAASGTPGYATDGDPLVPSLGSLWGASDFNILQEELMAFLVAAGIAPDNTGANLAQVLAACNALYRPGRLLNVQIFTVSGTYTPTPGTTSIEVEVIGGGGGGGGTNAAGAGQGAVGSGGGGGGYSRKRLLAGFAGTAVTVGSGGISVASSGGANGGTSSFGAFLLATGGTGGTIGNAASTSTVTPSGGAGGGTGSSGDVNENGMAGDYALYGPTQISGRGGASFLGGGGAAVGGQSAGTAGPSHGSGGSGGSTGPSGAAVAGGAGKAGIVIIREYA